MKRRVYLSAAGGVLLAGCVSRGLPAETQTPPPETPRTPTPAPTTESTPAPTPEQTPEPETPATPDEVDEALDEISESLAGTVAKFAAAAGDGAGLLDVRSTTRFSFDENAAGLYAARDLFYDARDEADESQRERLGRLWSAYKFLWWSGKSFERLGWAYRRSEKAVSAFYLGDYEQVASRADDVHSAVSEVEHTLDSLADESDADSLDAVDGLSAAHYSNVVSNVDRERAVFEAFAGLISTLASLVLRLDEGLTAYLAANDDDAHRSFYNLSWEFEELHRSVADAESTPAVRTHLDEFDCMTAALANGCRYLTEAAAAGLEGRPEARATPERRAEVAFERCELVMLELEMLPAFFEALQRGG